MDDITFCLRGMKDCEVIRCERHPHNIMDKTIPHSFAELYETEYCPLEKAKRKQGKREREPMDDLISREAALDGFKKACAVDVIEQHGWSHSEIHTCLTYGGIEKILNSVPTADAVEIVRCRDCKFNPNDTWFDCPMAHLPYKEDRWCWKGRRNDD